MIGFMLAAAAATAQPAYTPRPVSEADKAAIRKQADKVLFDGPTARWQWPDRLDAKVYCGQVNSKNRFGAYVGWTPFYFYEGELRIIGPDDSRVTYELFCGVKGYIPKADWIPD